jgi:DNA-binding response OmpR family regulator
MLRLLIVDDEESICFAMSEYFTIKGFKVDCANDLEGAETLLATHNYSAIIADLRLAGVGNIGGMEVVRRAHEKSPAVPIIILTAYGSPEVEADVRREHVDAFLHKPQPLRHVAQIVSNLIEHANA